MPLSSSALALSASASLGSVSGLHSALDGRPVHLGRADHLLGGYGLHHHLVHGRLARGLRGRLRALRSAFERRMDPFDGRRSSDGDTHGLLTLFRRGEVLVGLGEACHCDTLAAVPSAGTEFVSPKKANGPGERTEAQTPARNPHPPCPPDYPRLHLGAMGSVLP